MTYVRASLAGSIAILASVFLEACGGGSSYSSPPPPPPPDTLAPTVQAVQPPAAFVNRIVTLTVGAGDNVGVTVVRFYVDGALLGSDSTTPYSIDWDTSAETDGDHTLSAEAEDAAGNVGQSAAVVVTVRNTLQFDVALSAEQEVPPSGSLATAQAALTVNLISGDVTGDLTINGLDATAAHIHDAFAGVNGNVLVPLDQDPGDPSQFTVPAGATIDQAGVDRLLAGALYINVHTAALPGGEIRGQVLPDGFVLRFADLSGENQVPRVATVANGRAAITLDLQTGALVVQAQVDGLDGANQAHVHDAYAGANGPVLVALAQDAMDNGHWFVENGKLNTAGLEAFEAGRLYVNVHSPANPGGEVRGQIVPDAITVLTAELSGAQEVPAVDTNAAGVASLTLDQAGMLLTIHANTENLGDANAAHLHLAYAGANGPVEIGLTQDGSNPAHWFAEEQPLSAAQLDALLVGQTYVNVHAPANPGGEIRGQVVPDGIFLALGRLGGDQSVPPIATAAGGTFAVTIDPATSSLVAHANTNGVDDATAAHLHDGFAGENGPVAIGLTQDPQDVARWSVVGAALDAAQLNAVLAGGYYINVHTPANPAGEIRGQVAPPPVEVVLTTLSGDEEVPAVASAASGIAASTVNRETGNVTLHLNATGADDANASHIHDGFAGQSGGVLIGLTQDGADAGHWFAEGEQFDAGGLAEYLEGRLYVNLHTPANPGGEIRGQIAPRNIQVVFSPMDGGRVVSPVATAASGVAATTTDLAARSFVAFVNATGVDDATSAGIHVGAQGENGAETLPLQQTPMLVSQWSAMSAGLDPDTFSAYRAGRLYAQVATPAQPNGEIRGQIEPPNFAEFDDQDPSVTLQSPGANVSGIVTLNADATDNVGVTEVRFFANGGQIGSDTTAPYTFDWDSATIADGQVTLTAKAEDAAGNVGMSGDVVVIVMNGSGVTLTQIQQQVFSPICSGCHTGPTSSALPSGMNLTTAANSFAALVGVESIEVSGLSRVESGDPDNSYLIDKLEGTQTVGTRMPQGGPFLNQATINMIRDWITDGAPNN